MLNIYIYKKIEGLEHLHILDFYLGQRNFGVERAGDEAIKLFNKAFFNLVDTPEESDYLLIPYNYFSIKDREYVNVFVELSRKLNKKIIIFSYGDSSQSIDVPNCIVFRSSQYRSDKKQNEIIMPAIADDLLSVNELKFINKNNIPKVGFCGWAGYDGEWLKFKQYIKAIPTLVTNSPKMNGVLFRMKTLRVLNKSKLLKTNFVIRNSFTGNEKTRNGNFSDLRRDFVDNINQSDFSLALKGDGNYSVRFYEILSLGKIPLFVDTDCVFPLDDVIDYKGFVLKVDYKNIKNIAEIVSGFYRSLSPEDFILMQNKAREAFQNYLRADKYFEYVLNKEFFKKYD